MAIPSLSAAALIEALDEPALIVGGGRTIAANKAARDLLGESIVDRDIRIAIRHPQALGAILAAQAADLAVVGLGGAQRPWNLSIRPIAAGHCLVRLTDRLVARAPSARDEAMVISDAVMGRPASASSAVCWAGVMA